MASESQPPGLTTQITTNPLIPGPSIPSTQPTNPTPSTQNPPQTLAPKRHRRPSVRLGDIGDQPATIRTSKPWRLHQLHLNPNPNPNPNIHKSSSKIRPLTNLVTNGTTNGNSISHGKFPKEFKSKRTSNKRVRTNFRIDQQQDDNPNPNPNPNPLLDDQNDAKIHSFSEFDDDIDDDDDNHDNGEEGFRDFDPEIDGSDQEHTPIHSPHDDNDNDGNNDDGVHDMWNVHNRRSLRATRVSNSNHELGLGLGGMEANSNTRVRGIGLDDGVRKWLVELGLGRYAPVFEIHEVDDDVLPYLTLEDLKDMGINAVGSRRKLHSAILKLRKGLS